MTYHQRADWLLDRARDAEAVGSDARLDVPVWRVCFSHAGERGSFAHPRYVMDVRSHTKLEAVVAGEHEAGQTGVVHYAYRASLWRFLRAREDV